MGMQQHFVRFYSPGTFVAEMTDKPIDSWDVNAAQEMAHEIVERHAATPYGFRFITRGRDDSELDSKETAHSPLYYLGGRIETYEEVEARDDPKERTLRTNMRINGYKRIIVNDNSWRWTQPLDDEDIVLDWKPRQKSEAVSS